jgi:SnoaL-like domain
MRGCMSGRQSGRAGMIRGRICSPRVPSLDPPAGGVQLRAAQRGDYRAIVAQLAPDVHHLFAGDSALGGERHSRPPVERWFERLFRLCPQMSFEVGRVISSGPPWDIIAAPSGWDTSRLQPGSPTPMWAPMCSASATAAWRTSMRTRTPRRWRAHASGWLRSASRRQRRLQSSTSRPLRPRRQGPTHQTRRSCTSPKRGEARRARSRG